MSDMDTKIIKSKSTPSKANKGPPPSLGEIKWFGGTNKQTNRENDYGFIAGPDGDVYFPRSQSLSPPESLVTGAHVLFMRSEGKSGKPAAESVRVLSLIPDAELVTLLLDSEKFSHQDTLVLLLSRSMLPPCEHIAHQAVVALEAIDNAEEILAQFWDKFPPVSPKDAFFPLAPAPLKTKICRQHFSTFRDRLRGLFVSVTSTETSMMSQGVYVGLDDRDEKIALDWAGTNKNNAVLAKMLSARAAEKAVIEFYESTGSSVEDVSIRQLDGGPGDWTTHDLLVDSSVSVDVKNARRPVNGKRFYVEHTVARFKLDRKNAHVKIAGILSPYLQLEYIKEPHRAGFKIEELTFLGETSRDSVDQLVKMFGSPTFEITRANERTVPNWVFGYPRAWYRSFSEDVSRFAHECEWPEGEEWDYVLDDSEKKLAAPALCVSGKPLPTVLASKLHGWQSAFYSKIQRSLEGSPELPIIFLTILSDFLEKLRDSPRNFSPADYRPMLYDKDGERTVSYPLGAIDPLAIVSDLISTLTILWKNRDKTNLENLTNFRFSGLGILQGREKDQREWITIIAYCGGTVYQTDEEGNVILNIDGRPMAQKGKCGHSPLVIGKNTNCQACGKLVCGMCGFCCIPCQDVKFSKMAKAAKHEAERKKSEQPSHRLVPHFGVMDTPPEREEVPIEVYENDIRIR